MIEFVFLDAGETLLRPHPSFHELFAQVCRGYGREVAPGEVQEIQERLAPHLVDLAEETGVENPSLSAEASRTFWTYLYRRFLEALGIEDDGLSLELYSTFSSSSSYRLFDDVLPALDRLKEGGYRLGLISNFEGWLEEMLVELEVGHLFDAAVISGVEGVEKPDPRIYELAIARVKVPAEAAVHVGDSVVLDVRPALSVGMKAVLLDRAARYAQMDLGDVPRISSLEELPPLVANL
ncbi:MAG: HAD family hydrolase [Actinomycetota bacterium]